MRATPRNDPVDRALAAVVEINSRCRAPISTRSSRASCGTPRVDATPTSAALRAYAARVAGTVGVMMTLLMGERSAAALARACDLGIAMQLTNIARDVGEDARNGRLYLPADWLKDAGIDSDAWLADPRPDPRIAAVVARLLEEAATLYARSRDGIALLPADCRPAINAARLIYSEIGDEVARAGHDSVSRRAFVSGKRKLRLLVEAVLADSRSSGRPHHLLEEARFLIEAVPPRPQAIAASRAARILTIFEKAERKKIEAWASPDRRDSAKRPATTPTSSS